MTWTSFSLSLLFVVGIVVVVVVVVIGVGTCEFINGTACDNGHSLYLAAECSTKAVDLYCAQYDCIDCTLDPKCKFCTSTPMTLVDGNGRCLAKTSACAGFTYTESSTCVYDMHQKCLGAARSCDKCKALDVKMQCGWCLGNGAADIAVAVHYGASAIQR